MQVERDHTDPALAELAAIQRMLVTELPATGTVAALSPDGLRRHAAIALECARGSSEDKRVVLEIVAVELLHAARLDLAGDVAAARKLVEKLEEQFGLHPAVLARGLLRSPEILLLPPRMAMSAQLSMLMMLAPLDEVSVWTKNQAGHVQRMFSAGEPTDGAEVTKLALSLLRRGRRRTGAGELVAVVIEHSAGRVAAAIARSEPIFHSRVRALLAESVPVLAATLERDQLLARGVEMQRALADSRDRRLTRLGLDVHDGPLQDLASLGQDLGLFRKQLRRALEGHDREELLIGRIDDLEAQLVAVDSDLRRLAVSLQSPFLTHTDFVRALHESVESFSIASGIAPELHVTGDLTIVSESQQMALLAIMREGLNNVREHTDATDVTIRLTAHNEGVRAELTDNGQGFDVETTLVEAARGGHLGLVGMHERVRLLDGTSCIDSRPGGPTTVQIELPRWQPPH
jgi:signal transduction histidine kinase